MTERNGDGSKFNSGIQITREQGARMQECAEFIHAASSLYDILHTLFRWQGDIFVSENNSGLKKYTSAELIDSIIDHIDRMNVEKIFEEEGADSAKQAFLNEVERFELYAMGKERPVMFIGGVDLFEKVYRYLKDDLIESSTYYLQGNPRDVSEVHSWVELIWYVESLSQDEWEIKEYDDRRGEYTRRLDKDELVDFVKHLPREAGNNLDILPSHDDTFPSSVLLNEDTLFLREVRNKIEDIVPYVQ